MKNKIIVMMLALVLVFSSCSKGDAGASLDAKNSDKNSEKIRVVATTFPQYDWLREIAGDKLEDIDLTLLLDSGVDLHSYSPSADDIIRIKEADLFVYVGGHSDEWVDEVLDSGDSDVKLFNMMEVLGLGLDLEHEHEEDEHDDHEHEGEENADEEHEHEHEDEEHTDEHEHEDEEHKHEGGEHEHEHADEHVWLSLKNAAILTDDLAEVLGEIDSKNKEVYRKNADYYIGELEEVDKVYENLVQSSHLDTVLFADRFPFAHMFEDYELEHFSAFSGCSAESEASFETIAFLSDKLNDLNLSNVMTLEGSDKKLAETIIKTSGKEAKILELNSMQSITKKKVDDGAKYLDIMKENAKVLEEALNN